MHTSNSVKLKYLVEKDQDLHWGLMVSCVGFQEVLPGMHYPTGNHPDGYGFATNKGRILNEYQLLYITKGSGVFESSHQQRTHVKAGDMFLLFPGEWHRYCPDSDTGWKEYWIGFKGDNVDMRVQSGFFSVDHAVMDVGLHDDIVDTYMKAVDMAQQQKTGYQQMLAGFVNVLLGYCYYYNAETHFVNEEETGAIRKAQIYMREHFQESIRPEDVACEINMGYSKFRRMFKDYTGYAPLQYILELRLKRCCELLVESNTTLSEIAFSMGYESADFFSSAFKRKYGISPLAYRKRFRK